MLIKRRDAIGRAYLPAITPLADFTFDATRGLAFVNVAEQAKVAAAPSGGYRVQWLRMDNATGETTPIGGEVPLDGPSAPPPSTLPAGDDVVLTARVWAEDPGQPAWRSPIEASFMRAGSGWRLVGIDRLR